MSATDFILLSCLAVVFVVSKDPDEEDELAHNILIWTFPCACLLICHGMTCQGKGSKWTEIITKILIASAIAFMACNVQSDGRSKKQQVVAASAVLTGILWSRTDPSIHALHPLILSCVPLAIGLAVTGISVDLTGLRSIMTSFFVANYFYRIPRGGFEAVL